MLHIDEHIPPRSLALKVFESIVLLSMNILAFFGNTLIIIAVYRNKNLRTTINIYLIALAVSDFVNAVIVMPITNITLISDRWIFGEAVCTMSAFVAVHIFLISPAIMAILAVNRYIRIVKTNWYQKIFSPKRSFLLLGILWFTIAAYMLIPSLLEARSYRFVPKFAGCFVEHTDPEFKLGYYVVAVIAFLFGPLTVSFLCYYRVFKYIRQHNLDIAPSLQNRYHETGVNVHEIRISKLLFCVVLGFCICWIPSYLISMIVRYVPGINRNVAMICVFCTFLSSTINPFIYAGMNRAFRLEFKKILLCNTKNDSLPLQSRTEGRRVEELDATLDVDL